MKMNNTFDVILLIGRPASGKSEIIDFLKRLPDEERRQRFHLGQVEVLDDFPMLWTWFEEDDLLSNVFGLPRLHTDEQGYFKFLEFWHLLIERLCLEYRKILRDDPAYHDHHSLLIEFSRGSSREGYAGAFRHLSEEVLAHAAIVYVRVPFEESLRKNRRRFNPDKPDSILEHGLTDEKIERLYRDDDFNTLVSGDAGFLELQGRQVPFAIFPNEDDVTTDKPEQLDTRLASVLGELWRLYRPRK